LFPEISRRTKEFRELNPKASLINLGIGDTTLPLSESVIKALHSAAEDMADAKTYSGYGPEQGSSELRRALAEHYKKYKVHLEPDEIFVSDGAKSDAANIQSIFSDETIVAVQDPVYPAYVDSTVIGGKTGQHRHGRYAGIVYMPCTEENGFFPALPKEKVDLIYLCSPNNPTGAVASKQQLKGFVDYARDNNAVIIFDAAYAAFISDGSLPRSIYEIDGAEFCAIEINSFSKLAGFTGLRLGWTVVPHRLTVEEAVPGEVQAAWNRRQTTMFNGASNIIQKAGVAVLSKEGQRETQKLIDYYMENAEIIRQGLEDIGLKVFGGENAPYIWAKIPKSLDSWEFFDKLIGETGVVGTPGSGFGSGGEGFFRLSAFGRRSDVEEAVKRIKEKLAL
jgi:LL-diaminopimelate aminotransferase